MDSHYILSKDQTDLLYDLYYNKNMMVGRDRLYKYIQDKYPDSRISRRMVMSWLANQELHQIYAPAKRTINIQTTILKEPKKQIGIDLVDMSNKQYNNYKYILTGIDLFSKKAYVKALKNKEANTVANAMDDLIKNDIHYVSTLRSDNGSEFIADEFKKVLKKYDIKSVFGLPGKPQSNGNIERFNKTLKRMLAMTMMKNDNNDWVSVLPDVVDAYNMTYNRIIKDSPNNVDEEDDKDTLKEIKNNISTNTMKRNENNFQQKFKKGQKVRIKLDESISGRNWSDEIYKIYEVQKPKKKTVLSYAYLIEDKDEKFTKKYYNNDLLLVPIVENKLNKPIKYVISSIVRPVVRNKLPHFEIRWKGFTDKDNTIEPRSELMKDVPKMVLNYEKAKNVMFYPNTVIYEKN